MSKPLQGGTMKIIDVLSKKSKDLFSINEDRTVVDCLAVLNEKHIGILVVRDKNGAFIGMVSERDVLRAVADRGRDYTKLQVSQIMTPRARIFSVQKDERFEKAMTLMTENRVRHIPIMDGDEILGVVSIGDLMKNLLESVQFENEQLNKYITGGY